MNEIIFEALKLIVMVAALIVSTRLLPLIKVRIGKENLETIDQWAYTAVMYAEQWYKASTGAEKKQIVTRILKEIRETYHIDVTDEQMEILLEAAVKQMNQSEITIVEEK